MAGIAPWISVADPAGAVAFYERAFGATVVERHDDDQGSPIVVGLVMDGAELWVAHDPDATPEAVAGEAIRMILSVSDPDRVQAAALAAGATEIAAVYEDFGWRIGRIADPSGHHWEIGRRLTEG